MPARMRHQPSGSSTSSGDNEEQTAAAPAASMSLRYPVGTVVRVTGLQVKRACNNHVGQVIAAPNAEGRLGVRLHSSVWPPSTGGCSPRVAHAGGGSPRVANTGGGSPRFANSGGGSPRVTNAGASSPRLLSDVTTGRSGNRRDLLVKPMNLRPVKLPDAMHVVSLVGTAPRACILRHIGQHGLGLPDDVVCRVADFLSIYCIDPERLTVVGCSSTRGDYPLGAVLDSHLGKWWISEAGSMPGGCGEEYLEFSFGATPRRVSYVGVDIPPLPNGPLSVRKFHLLALSPLGSSACRAGSSKSKTQNDVGEDVAENGVEQDDAALWVRIGPDEEFETLDVTGLQEVAVVPPVDTCAVRLVCTRNAMATAASTENWRHDASASQVSQVGLFAVRFA